MGAGRTSTRWRLMLALSIGVGVVLTAQAPHAADGITDENLKWQRLSRDATRGMSFSTAAQTVNYYFIQRPDSLGRNPDRAVMVMTRFEYLVNEMMRNSSIPRGTKVKLYEARNNIREAAGLSVDLSVNDAIMSLNSLGKLMALQDLDEIEQVEALKSEWSDVDLQYLQVALEDNDVLGKSDSAEDNLSSVLASLQGELSRLDGFSTQQFVASLGSALQSGAIDLATAASSVASTIASGVSVNLDSVAQSGGFDSFADAVDAYNSQYGTNYTVDEAREALGQ